jgi:hypothetical protein
MPPTFRQQLSEIKDLQQQLDDRLTEVLDRVNRLAGLPAEPLSAPPPASNGDHEGASTSLVAFVHIPKTAGGTVKGMISAAASGPKIIDSGNFFRTEELSSGKIEQKLTSAARSRVDAVTIGHVPYGVYRRRLPAGTRYITFLREPVDRVVSHFYRHVMNWDGGAKVRFAGVDSLERALTDTDLPEIRNLQPALNNLQTRCLCWDPSPLGRLPESALDEAKAHLREFAFVGIQEQFTESLVLLQRALGLPLQPNTDRHVNLYRPSVDDIDPKERQLIEECNSFDLELYRYARALFQERIAEAGDDFEAEVEAMRAATTAVNHEDHAELAATADWLDRQLPPGTKKLDEAVRNAAAEAGISNHQLKRAARFVKNRREGREGSRAASGAASSQ